MDSFNSQDASLTGRDRCLLLLACTLLFGYTLVNPRTLNPHETTHCLNVREMLASGEYIIPTFGGRPWLERPPVPHWLTAVGVVVLGEANPERAYRLGSIVVATLAVLVFASCAAGCFGRSIGLGSGLILASMREFFSYATGPEADIFLASAVTIACSLVMRALFHPIYRDTRQSLFGRRSWMLIAYFLLVGLMNAMKGPLFGMFFAVLPLGVLALVEWRAVRPLIWFWGALLTLAVGIAWPILAYLRYPDIVELWAVDYGVRWRTGYLGEPSWYYLVNQPWNVFPWTIPVVVGVAVTWRQVRHSGQPAMRYVWCWALVPVAFFTLFKGKHHHYLLGCLAPCAVLGAFGMQAIWQRVRQWSVRGRSPVFVGLLASAPGVIAIVLFWSKLPGPGWVHLVWMAAFVLIGVGGWYFMTRPDLIKAMTGLAAVFIVVHCLFYEYRTSFLEEWANDMALLDEVPSRCDGNRPLFVLGEGDPLLASWPMFYLDGRAKLQHNDTYLLDDRLEGDGAYIVCRRRDLLTLMVYGEPTLVAESVKTRSERSIDDRYSLYLLRFYPNLPRVPADVRMTPLQATGRAEGPYLNRALRPTAERTH